MLFLDSTTEHGKVNNTKWIVAQPNMLEKVTNNRPLQACFLGVKFCEESSAINIPGALHYMSCM
jgi:hypothetical protein